MKPQPGSLAAAVMLCRSVHETPSSLLWRANTSRLSLQYTRVMVELALSNTGAGLPDIWTRVCVCVLLCDGKNLVDYSVVLFSVARGE